MSADTDLFGHPALERRASDGLTRADGGSDEWLTPPSIIAALGAFDLRSWRTVAPTPGCSLTPHSRATT